MSKTISWLQVVSVESQNLGAFEVLMDELVAAARRDDGVSKMDWNIALNQSSSHIHVGCADNEAALRHLTMFRVKFSRRFHALTKTERVTVYGRPDIHVRSALPDDAEYMVNAGGFSI